MILTSGRRVKFTPERIEQIKSMIAQGVRREQIAQTIDVTVGSLQVTCSRLGISLRPPRATPKPLSSDITNDFDSDRPQFELVISLHGRERRLPLNLPREVITDLALDAAIQGVSVAQVITARLIDGAKP
jgi:hypothetical protein